MVTGCVSVSRARFCNMRIAISHAELRGALAECCCRVRSPLVFCSRNNMSVAIIGRDWGGWWRGGNVAAVDLADTPAGRHARGKSLLPLSLPSPLDFAVPPAIPYKGRGVQRLL